MDLDLDFLPSQTGVYGDRFPLWKAVYFQIDFEILSIGSMIILSEIMQLISVYVI